MVTLIIIKLAEGQPLRGLPLPLAHVISPLPSSLAHSALSLGFRLPLVQAPGSGTMEEKVLDWNFWALSPQKHGAVEEAVISI